MEGCFFGIFLVFFLLSAAFLATPIAVAVGGIIAWWQEHLPPQERRLNAVMVGWITFTVLMLGACLWLEM